MVSNILIWNEKVGFIQANEGNGSNLTLKDEQSGYVDYIILAFITYNGYDFEETDGAQVMLSELYQEKFEDEAAVVQFLIHDGWIPDEEYTYLYAGQES